MAVLTAQGYPRNSAGLFKISLSRGLLKSHFAIGYNSDPRKVTRNFTLHKIDLFLC